MVCENCGHENPEGSEFCIKCGTALTGDAPAEPVQEPIADAPVQEPVAAEAIPPAWAGQERSWLRPALMIGGAIVVLAVILAVVLTLAGGGGQSEHLLLASYEQRGETELYLLKPGQERDEDNLIAEEIDTTAPVQCTYMDKRGVSKAIGTAYGGFVPQSKHLIYWLVDGNDIVIRGMAIGDRESYEILDSRDPLSCSMVEGSDFVFFVVSDRCSTARLGEEAERLGRADRCWLSEDGTTAILREERAGETTVTIIGVDGKGETTMLDQVEDVGSVVASDDASHLAYVQETRGGEQLFLIKKGDDEATEVSEEFPDISFYRFLPESDILYYIAVNEDLMRELYISGDTERIAEEELLRATASPDGRHLVYLAGDEGDDLTLYAHPTRGGEGVELVTAEELEYAILSDPAKILILARDRDELTLYSADTDGGNLVELFSQEDAILSSGGTLYVSGEPKLYLFIQEGAGSYSLFVTSADRADGFYLLEEWDAMQLLNRSAGARQLAFVGREDEGDDAVLYSIEVKEDARPIELDDDHGRYVLAVFASNGKTIIYSATTEGTDSEVEVCQVPTDGSEKYQVLYEEASLADVRWDSLRPFASLWWEGVR
jgi:hypothetical protein